MDDNDGVTNPIPVIDFMGTPISECDDVEFLRNTVEKLWQLLDDIDTISDFVKGDDKAYRTLVESKQAERWTETQIVSDGYRIFRGVVDPDQEETCECYARGLNFHMLGCPDF